MTIQDQVIQACAPLRAVRAIGVKTGVSPAECVSTHAMFKARLGSGFLAALVGERGTGKTVLGTALIGDAILAGHTARYATLTRFLMEIKATYGPEASGSELAVIEAFLEPQFLVLDEMGRRAETDWGDRLIFELLDGRYQAMKDTLLLSNESHDTFTASIGPSLASRMVEAGGVITCNWPSFRQ